MSYQKKLRKILYRQVFSYCLLLLLIGTALLAFPLKVNAGFGLREVWYPNGEIRWYAETTPGLQPYLTSTQVNSVIEPTMRYMSERLPLNIQRRFASSASNLMFKKSVMDSINPSRAWTYGYWAPDGELKNIAYFSNNGIKSETTAHEFGHALGMPHEHQRPDANESGQVIIGSGITCGEPFNYGVIDNNNFFQNGIRYHSPFDERSAMLYDQNTCVRNAQGTAFNQPTYPPSNPNAPRALYSPDDINSIYRVYGRALGKNKPDEFFGHATAVFDLDDDEFEDIVVAAYNKNNIIDSEINLYFYRGVETDPSEKDSGRRYMPWFVHNIDTASFTGFEDSLFNRLTLASGDFNNDGRMELAVGYPHYGLARERRVTIYGQELPTAFPVGCSGYEPWGVKGLRELQTITPSDIDPEYMGRGTFGLELEVGRLTSSTNDDLLIGWSGATKRQFGSTSQKESGAVVHLRGISSSTSPLDVTTSIIIENPALQSFPIPFPSGSARHDFGSSISLVQGSRSGAFDTLVIGAPGYDSNRGRVYIYGTSRNTSSLPIVPTLLTTLEGEPNSRFGHSLASIYVGNATIPNTNHSIVIGAPNEVGNIPIPSMMTCETLRSEIEDLQREREDWQSELDSASPGQKPFIVSLIKSLNQDILTKQSELKNCMESDEDNEESGAIGAVYHYGIGNGSGATTIQLGRHIAPSHRLSSNMQWGYSLSVLGDGIGRSYDSVQVGIGAPGAELNKGLVFAWHPFTTTGDFSRSGASLTAPNSGSRYGEVINSISFDTRHGFLISAPRGIVDGQDSGFVQARINQQNLTSRTWRSDRQVIHQGIKGDHLPDNL